MSDQYSYRVEWSGLDQAYVGRCLEFPSLAAHGEDRHEALREIETVVAESVGWMTEEGEEVPDPVGRSDYRGNILFRTTPEIHRALVLRAREEGVSVNALLSGLVQRNLSSLGLDHDIHELRLSLGDIQRDVATLHERLRAGAHSGPMECP